MVIYIKSDNEDNQGNCDCLSIYHLEVTLYSFQLSIEISYYPNIVSQFKVNFCYLFSSLYIISWISVWPSTERIVSSMLTILLLCSPVQTHTDTNARVCTCKNNGSVFSTSWFFNLYCFQRPSSSYLESTLFFFFICSGFCNTLKWNSHGFTCVPHPDPPSHLPLYPLPLGFPSAPGPSACLMHPTWAGDLFHPR